MISPGKSPWTQVGLQITTNLDHLEAEMTNAKALKTFSQSFVAPVLFCCKPLKNFCKTNVLWYMFKLALNLYNKFN